MAWFQLDAESTLARMQARGGTPSAPGPARSLVHGMAGFTLVSVAGFVPWAVFGGAFKDCGGELGMYAACAAVFLALSGPAMHGLIAGPGALWRFYALFGIGFTLNAIAWTACWMLLRGHTGSLAGLLLGNALMGVVFALAFGVPRQAWKTVLILFAANAAGYFIGGFTEAWLWKTNKVLAMLSWGVCYGLGLGAGLGAALYVCQARLRTLLR
ncbi:MAG: hypothetical protein KIS92_18660 [Planctomycetota bacterium]|nr:hypothetical protein [Planctomycetota bacterium]